MTNDKNENENTTEKFDFVTTLETMSTIRKLERYKNDLNTLLDEANLTEDEAQEVYNAFASVNTTINLIRKRRIKNESD